MASWHILFDRRDGFQVRLAKRCGLSRQTVNGWRKGIPTDYCADVEAECGQEFRRWDFRPDTWHRIWPELKRDRAAPPIPTKAGS